MGKQGLILSQRKKPRENWRRCGEQSLGGILWEWEEVALSEQELMYQTSFPKELFSRPLCGFCAIKKLKKLEMASAAKLQTAGVYHKKYVLFHRPASGATVLFPSVLLPFFFAIIQQPSTHEQDRY